MKRFLILFFLLTAFRASADVFIDGENINDPAKKIEVILVTFDLRGWYIVLPGNTEKAPELRKKEVTGDVLSTPGEASILNVLNFLEVNGWEYVAPAPAAGNDISYFFRKK